MTPKKEPLSVRAARGEYVLVLPLDRKILEVLPPEGTTLAGLYELGASTKELQKSFPMLATGTISARLRLLKEQGLTRIVKLVGGGTNAGQNAWQRTHAAEDLLRKLKEDGNANG